MTPTDKPVFSFSVTASDVTDPPTATCTPESVTVDTSNALIDFQLQTPGYVFDPEGPITFNEATTDFPDLWFISPTQVTLRDRCTTAGDFAFTVHVIESSSGRRIKVDPGIRNTPR
ncbi:UNVERIFIED_ORG: hypothetical protein LHJ69_06105 [Shinella sp. XGS7]|jgi:hypothetical protein|nr:hypothetical protein [Shinella sp. XGS7]